MAKTQREKKLEAMLERESSALAAVDDELEATYAALRSLAGGAVEGDRAWKAAVVGLLPEVRDLEPEEKERMRAKGLGHLVERREENVGPTSS